MADAPRIPWTPLNFLALPREQSDPATARTVLIPVPYDSTTSYRSGARDGPAAILAASYNLEDFDHELGADAAALGIHTTDAIEPHMAGPAAMVDRVADAVAAYDAPGRLVGLLGGEHTITVGAVRALASRRPNLSVLYLDAHGDLRDDYMGTPYSHATVARRLQEICPVTQVGVRNMSREEWEFIHGENANVKTFVWNPAAPALPDPGALLSRLTNDVYVSVDLDALDPSLMPAVGTPEPGGMSWAHVLRLIETVARRRRIVGFDVTELSPGEGPHACAYTAARLVYKLIGHALAPGAGGNRPAAIAAGQDLGRVA